MTPDRIPEIESAVMRICGELHPSHGFRRRVEDTLARLAEEAERRGYERAVRNE